MDDLIKLVKTYRVTSGLAERLRLAERIFDLIEFDLRVFVFASIRPSLADDVLQETFKGIVTGLGKFTGGSIEEFWAWCYRITRNKLSDQFRRQATDRLVPIPQEELQQLVESSVQTASLSPADKHDLEYAIGLLESSKPECREYLWQHFVFGLEYAEIAAQRNLSYDATRMKIGRCLEEAQSLVS